MLEHACCVWPVLLSSPHPPQTTPVLAKESSGAELMCSGESTVCCLVGNLPLSTLGISHSGLCVPSSGRLVFFWERLNLGM